MKRVLFLGACVALLSSCSMIHFVSVSGIPDNPIVRERTIPGSLSDVDLGQIYNVCVDFNDSLFHKLCGNGGFIASSNTETFDVFKVRQQQPIKYQEAMATIGANPVTINNVTELQKRILFAVKYPESVLPKKGNETVLAFITDDHGVQMTMSITCDEKGYHALLRPAYYDCVEFGDKIITRG